MLNQTYYSKNRYPIIVNKKLGFIDYQGNEIIPPIHTRPPGASGLLGFYDDVAWVFEHNQYTLLDIEGNELFRCDFDNVHTYCNGLAKVQTTSGLGKGLKTYEGKNRGLIDKQGKFIIQPHYDNLFNWHRDFIVVVQKGLYGTIDYSGATIIKPSYRNLTSISHHGNPQFLAATNSDKKIAVLSLQGKPLTAFIYDEVGLLFVDNRLLFKKKGCYGYLDQHLHEVISAQYDQAYEFAEGFARVANRRRYGCINTDGEIIIPMNYLAFYGFSEGLAAVKKPDEYFGYINTQNNYVIEPIYDEALWFGDGIAKVKLDGNEGYIDKQQNTIISFNRYDFLQIEDSLIKFQLNRKYGFYGLDGKLLIQPEYKTALAENGLIKVEEGYINYQGDWVWLQPTLPEANFFFTSMKSAPLNSTWIKQQTATQFPEWKFNSTLSESAVNAIEQLYKIQLPKDYREFLLTVGNGGPGPMEGLYKLQFACENSSKLNEDFLPSEITDDENDFFDKPGILLIGSDHVVYTFGLVTSGPEYGNIWFSDSRYWFPYTPVFWQAIDYYDDYDMAADYLVKNQLKIPRMRFYDWYYQWLNQN